MPPIHCLLLTSSTLMKPSSPSRLRLSASAAVTADSQLRSLRLGTVTLLI